MSKRPSATFNDPGYFYNQRRLLKLFTFAAVALVVGVVWLVIDDWDRPWKDEQRANQKWLAQRYATENFILETRTQDLRRKLEKERRQAVQDIAARQAALQDVRKQLETARGEFYLADMAYKEKKQFTLKDEFEVSHDSESQADVEKRNMKYLRTLDEEKRLREASKLAQGQVERLIKKEKQLESELNELVDRERKDPQLKRMKLLAAAIEKNRGYNPLREVPLLDFLAPPTKVEQIVLKKLVDNYEFSTPAKVDRCGTCHLGATKTGFEESVWPVDVDRGTPEGIRAFEEAVYRFVFNALDQVWTPVPRAASFYFERNVLRTLEIHHETLTLLFQDYDRETGEIGLHDEKDPRRKEEGDKVWRRWSYDEAKGRWVEDRKNGESIGNFYLTALNGMRKQWLTHPHFDDMVGDQSPHPYEKFGCSICHQGRGWSVDFGLAYHMPDRVRVEDNLTAERAKREGMHLPESARYSIDDAMQVGLFSVRDDDAARAAKTAGVHTGWLVDQKTGHQWEEELGWTETKRHYWAWPQFPKMLVQSACLKCHKEGYLRPAEPEYENVRLGPPDPATPDISDRQYHFKKFNDNAAAEQAGEYRSRLFVPKAEKGYRPTNLERGLDDFRRFGCYGCHKLDPKVFPLMENVRPKVGPPLDDVSTKVATKDWFRKWIRNPKDFRPDTKMPQFWHLSNNSHTFTYLFADGRVQEVDGIAWGETEVYAISEYLWDASERLQQAKGPAPAVKMPAGDAERGLKIVVGDWKSSDGLAKACIACHDMAIDPKSPLAPSFEKLRGDVDSATGIHTGWGERMQRRQGPTLSAIGSKLRPDWLFRWLKNPRAYWHDTNMPDLRLTDQEAADVVAFLMTLRSPEFENMKPVPKHSGILLKMAQELKAGEGRGRTDTALATVQRMDERERTLYVGRKLIKHYGCFGCHQIEEFKHETPIGTEITDWGSKLIERLEFLDAPIDHTRFDFAYTKLMNPRIYDLGRPRRDRPYERLRMPRFGFAPEEAMQIATFLISLVSDPIPVESRYQADPRRAAILRGREVVRRYNCQGCHVIEGEGGDIWPVIQDAKWRPPDLLGQGFKTQPQWLFQFLKDPAFVTIPGVENSDRVRPWHSIRMPTFQLSDEEARALVRYFAALSGQPADFESGERDALIGPEAQYAEPKLLPAKDPKDETKTITLRVTNRLEEARGLFKEYACKSCHSAEAEIQNAAPNFRHARAGRLRDEWIVTWLWGPSKLQEGTSMPTFFVNEVEGKKVAMPQDRNFFGGDPAAQIHALRDYVRFHYREED